MASRSVLGDYLRARRELIQPDDVGLVTGASRRRVAGLRREEVAILAGISGEYYLRLEQGRDTNPTDQVLDALARALLLDDAATAYLHELARCTTADEGSTAEAGGLEQLEWLINSWPMTAALLHNRHLDILASNALMRALVPEYRPGANSLVSLLVEPRARTLYRDWHGLTARSVALLRTMIGPLPENARSNDLVAELMARSERFADLWVRHDVIQVRDGTHIIDHPDVGALELYYSLLPLAGADGHSLFVYHAEPGSRSASALATLSSRLAGAQA